MTRVVTVTVDDKPLGEGHVWHTILGAHPDDARFPLVCSRCLLKHSDPLAFQACDALVERSHQEGGDASDQR